MKRLAWLTDIHLNFLGEEAVEAFLLGGDIGEAHDLATRTGRARPTRCPT